MSSRYLINIHQNMKIKFLLALKITYTSHFYDIAEHNFKITDCFCNS